MSGSCEEAIKYEDKSSTADFCGLNTLVSITTKDAPLNASTDKKKLETVEILNQIYVPDCNEAPNSIDDRDQNVHKSFSFILEGTPTNSRKRAGSHSYPNNWTMSTVFDDSTIREMSKLNVIEFDESVYRKDDSKSDVEFLEPRFLKDLENASRECGKRSKDRELRAETVYDQHGADRAFWSREENIAAEAKQNIVEEVLSRRDDLPLLHGFLEKLSPAIHSRWQRRWVAVVDSTIYWFKEEVNVLSSEDAEKHGYLNKLRLTTVARVAKDDKAKRGEKFDITARDPRTGDMRHYKWRCRDVEMCNYWVCGLNQHKDQNIAELKMGVHNVISFAQFSRDAQP